MDRTPSHHRDQRIFQPQTADGMQSGLEVLRQPPLSLACLLDIVGVDFGLQVSAGLGGSGHGGCEDGSFDEDSAYGVAVDDWRRRKTS